MFVLCLVAWLLSLGRAFGSTNAWTNLLPMRQLSHFPLFSAMLPTRFVVFYGFGIAVLIAVGIDGWSRRFDDAQFSSRRSLRYLAHGGLLVILLVGLMPFGLRYRALPAGAVHEPWWFAHRAHSIPRSHTVLVYPTYSSLLYEAMERFPFKTVGGYAIIPDAHGESSFIGKRQALDTFLVEAETLFAGLKTPTLRQLALSQAALHRRSVDNIVILTKSFNAGYVASTMVALTGSLPVIDHRVMVWSDLQNHHYPRVTSETKAVIDACALTHRNSAAVAASCTANELHLR